MPLTRHQLYGLVHKGAFAFLQLNQMDKAEADNSYRSWLQQKLGVDSCKRATLPQLEALVRELKQKGALAKPSARSKAPQQQGGQTANRPTQKQYNKLNALIIAKGWHDIEDPHLLDFIKRTAKVDAVRFLTRRQMSNVITGLEKWING